MSFFAAALLALALLAAGCGRSGGSAAPETTPAGTAPGGERLSGRIQADGSSTVGPYATAAAERFREQCSPTFSVTVGISGTGGGFERFCRGETDLSDASRPIKDEEAAGLRGATASSMSSSRSRTTRSPSSSTRTTTGRPASRSTQLKKIWEPGSKVESWSDVDAGFPDEPLKLFGPGTDSGTFDYFTEEINGEAGASRSDYAATEDDNVIVQGVAGEQGGLGYFGLSYYEQNADTLKALEIDGGDGCVAPSVATAQNGTLQAALAPALHLREEGVVRAARGRGVHRLHPRQRDGDRGGRPSSSR